MNAFVYDSALYCEDCGSAIRARLTAEGSAPESPEDETSYDSDDFPKGPYEDGGGSADCPQHCDSCKVFLENPLTPDGVAYVQGAIAEHFASGRGDENVLKAWAEFYKLPFNEGALLFATFNRFEIAMPLECVRDCSRSGAVDADVARELSEIESNAAIKPEDIRAELQEYGAWDETELSDDLQNWERIVWCAACNLKEERA